MAVGQRTTKQKVLHFISILFIIVAVLGFFIAFASFFGAAALLESTDASSFSFSITEGNNSLSTHDKSAVEAILLIVLLIILLPGSIIDLIIGILGIRGSNNASKVGAFTVFSVIGLIVSVILLLASIGSVFALFPDPSSDINSSLQDLKNYADSGAAEVDKFSYMDSGIIGSVISIILSAICVWLGVSIKKEGNPTQTQPQGQVQIPVPTQFQGQVQGQQGVQGGVQPQAQQGVQGAPQQTPQQQVQQDTNNTTNL